MTAPRLGEVTMLLQQVAAGQHDARGRLAELVYDELRVLADRQLRGMRGQTLQPTVLVHEAWLRLLGDAVGEFNNRQHFLGVAAKAMRSVLVDHVRKRKSQKRGGDVSTGPLDESVAFLEAGEVDLLDLDEALRELEASDADLARQVEMKFFSGMTNAEIAAVEGVSESTVERGWRFARARLRSRLDGGTRA
jgi:RNA polymerase sigma factor (TIGR02999 family)